MHQSILSGAAASCALLCAAGPALADEAAVRGPTNLLEPSVAIADNGLAYNSQMAAAAEFGRAPDRPLVTVIPVSVEQTPISRALANALNVCVLGGVLKKSNDPIMADPVCAPAGPIVSSGL